MQISPHFDDSEFECKCGCGFRNVHGKLLGLLEEIRSWYDQPITITSGCRCRKHNNSVGGSQNSQHMFGLAADFRVTGVDARKVYADIDAKYPNTLGLGKYSGRVHVDTRSHKARWEG